MKLQTAKVIGSISLLIAIVGVAAPISITFVDAVEQHVTAVIPVPLSDEDPSLDILLYSLLFLPVNLVALIMGIFARRSTLGKAGIVVSGIGICLVVGGALGALMQIIMWFIWPPMFFFPTH